MESSSAVELTREELYQRVWSTPMRLLAKEFGLSDVGLAKVCKRHKIPKPSRGYWAKLQNGKRVARHPLRPLDDEALKIVRLSSPPAQPEPREVAPEARDPRIASLIVAEREPEKLITVPDDLKIRHPLLRATKQALAKSKADEYGRLRPRYDFTDPHFGVGVSPANLPRALRILQALIDAMNSRGFELKTEPSKPAEPFFAILGRSFSVSIWEPSKRVKSPPPEAKQRATDRWSWYTRKEYEHVPSGQLELHLNGRSYYSSPTLRDTAKRRIEQRLNELMCMIFRSIDEAQIREEKARLEAQAKEEHRQREIAKEIERRSNSVRAQNLVQLATTWQEARKLEAFIAAVHATAHARSDQLTDETSRWLEWAESYLHQLDPLSASSELPIYSLSDEDRDKLRRECEADWSEWLGTFQRRP